MRIVFCIYDFTTRNCPATVAHHCAVAEGWCAGWAHGSRRDGWRQAGRTRGWTYIECFVT